MENLERVIVRYTVDGTATITLNRPDKLNPLDWATIRDLSAALQEIGTRDVVDIVVITGRGRSFSAGGDLDGYLHLYEKSEDFHHFLSDFHKLLHEMEASSKIFIAAVNGLCVAGGLELLLACDLAIGVDTARIGDGHLNFGQLPGAGGSQRLPRAIGLQRAKHLMLTGRLIDAREAERIGLLCQVVPSADLDATIAALIGTLREKSSAGLRHAKRLANLTLHYDLNTGLQQELKLVHEYATTHPDATEGLLAFKEKRKPRYNKT